MQHVTHLFVFIKNVGPQNKFKLSIYNQLCLEALYKWPDSKS